LFWLELPGGAGNFLGESMRMNSFLVSLTTLMVASFGFIIPAAQGQGFTGVFTQHNDNARTGQNLNETILTTANVKASKFGKVFSYPVDGQIYAQPLYVPNVTIPNHGVHNVLYVATENDTLYAFDADGLTPNILWSLSFINPSNGVTTINCISAGIVCNVYPITGITSTPVIDPTSNTIYLLVRTQEKGTSVQRLHALDITTGAEKFGGPVEIAAIVNGTGTGTSRGKIQFDALHDNQRTALLLANGNIYIGWAGQAHGWIMAYNAQTLAQVAVVNTTPNGTLGGVWQAGNGPAVDSEGNIYFSTGDGTFDLNTGGVDFGDSLVKMDANLNLLDYFTPMDQACRLLPNDLDLGSGGPLVLPPQAGTYADEIIEAGKGGSPCDLFGSTYAVPIYLVNRDTMGKYDPTQDQDIETVEGTVHGYWSSPTYWQSPTTQVADDAVRLLLGADQRNGQRRLSQTIQHHERTRFVGSSGTDPESFPCGEYSIHFSQWNQQRHRVGNGTQGHPVSLSGHPSGGSLRLQRHRCCHGALQQRAREEPQRSARLRQQIRYAHHCQRKSVRGNAERVGCLRNTAKSADHSNRHCFSAMYSVCRANRG
jgi:hypothetical protein